MPLPPCCMLLMYAATVLVPARGTETGEVDAQVLQPARGHGGIPAQDRAGPPPFMDAMLPSVDAMLVFMDAMLLFMGAMRVFMDATLEFEEENEIQLPKERRYFKYTRIEELVEHYPLKKGLGPEV
eukprot:278916-Rhodomonas_salina.3